MTLTVAPANKTAVEVTVTDSAGVIVLYNQKFSGTASSNFYVSQGRVTIRASIVEGNGNTSFTLTAVTPEAVTVTFTDPEIPLGDGPSGLGTSGKNNLMIFLIVAEAVIILGMSVLMVLLMQKRRKREQSAISDEQ